MRPYDDLTHLQRAVSPLSLLQAILGPEVCGAILQWDHNYLPIPEPDARFNGSADRALYLSSHERGISIVLPAR